MWAAIRASGRKRLPESVSGACPLLHPQTKRCLVYDGRPFGCRTHFCAAAGGPYERLALALLYARRTRASLDSAGRAVAPGGDDVVAFLADEGFDPRPAEDGGVVLAACPLAHGVELDPAVCSVHRGMLTAVAARRGQVVKLVVGRPGTCRVVSTESSPDLPSPSTDVDDLRRTP